MKENEWLQKILLKLLFSLLILIVFFVCVDLYQYSTTEIFWLQDGINYTHTTIFLLLLITIFSLVKPDGKLTKWSKFYYLIIGLFLITIVVHQKYIHFYDDLQEYPRIKSLSKNWGIHGSWVKVSGRNFGGGWEPGKIYIGKTEMTIKRWENKEIIFEIPVNVEQGKQVLEVRNARGNKQKEYFEFYTKFNLKDASEVLK